jgi:hypothetical protein
MDIKDNDDDDDCRNQGIHATKVPILIQISWFNKPWRIYWDVDFCIAWPEIARTQGWNSVQVLAAKLKIKIAFLEYKQPYNVLLWPCLTSQNTGQPNGVLFD